MSAPYFTVAEARALKPLNNVTLYPDAAITAARDVAQTALEEACAVAFTPSAFTDTVVSPGTTKLLLRPRLRSVDWVETLDGTPIDPTWAYTTVEGIAYMATGWPAGPLVVSGEHGYDAPPPRVARAALLLTKRFLVDSPISDRATSHQSPDGATEFYVTAGRGGAFFDVPEANAVVELYGIRSGLLVA